MKLSMWILADWLKKYHPTVKIESGRKVLRNVRMLTAGSVSRGQNVYVTLSEAFFGQGDGVICVHEKDLLVLKTDDIEQVFNDILEAFDYYNDWSDSLLDRIENGASLKEIIDSSIELFKDPLIILNTAFIAIAISDGYNIQKIDQEWSYLQKEKSVPLERVQQTIRLVPAWKKSKKPYHMDDSVFPYSSITRNLFTYKRFKGTLTIIEINNNSSKGRVQLFDELADLIECWLFHNEDQKELRDEAAIFLDLLEGRPVLPAEVTYKLDLLGWRREDEKLLIKTKSNVDADNIQQALAASIERNFSSCCVVGFEQSIVIIANLRLKGLKFLLQELAPYLVQSASYAGISYVFCDITLLKQHYEQAEIALQNGARKTGELYDCKDYALSYGLNVINENVSTKIYHPGLDRLVAYDRQHNSQLYDTLRYFLFNDRSRNLTALAFNIHRNSLAYRLQRIQEIIKEDLDDQDIRLYLIFSILLKDRQNTVTLS